MVPSESEMQLFAVFLDRGDFVIAIAPDLGTAEGAVRNRLKRNPERICLLRADLTSVWVGKPRDCE